MSEPKFIDGQDSTTYVPFELDDQRESVWNDVRLSFDDWRWLKRKYRTDTIDGYFLNGYSIQRLVIAARVTAGLEACPDGLELGSEADTCYIHFNSLELAVETAELAQSMIRKRDNIVAMIAMVRRSELED